MGNTKKSESQPFAPYASPTPGEISVIASGIEKHDQYKFEKTFFDELKDCNFNAALVGCGAEDDIKTGYDYKVIDGTKYTLERAEKAGISVIAFNYYFCLGVPRDPETGILWDDTKCMGKAKNFYNIFSSLKDDGTPLYGAIKGWALKDEPTYDQLTAVSKVYSLRSIIQYMNGGSQDMNDESPVRNKLPIQVNLVGKADENFMGEAPNNTYDKYLAAFANLDLNLWSYDLYPIQEKSCLLSECDLADNCKIEVDYRNFYRDLVEFSNITKNNSNVVFWAYAQSMEYSKPGLYRPAATEPYLRFEIFSALAFGAQGIVYWTYRQRNNSETETYLSALIGRHGNKTPAWYFAQRVNAEVKKYSDVFVNSKLVGYWHVVKPYDDAKDSVKIPTAPPTAYPWLLASVPTGSAGCLITLLKNGSRRYIVIVSHDVVNYQDVTLLFLPGGKIKFLTPLKSGGEGDSGFQSAPLTITRTLIPGGYLIIEYQTT